METEGTVAVAATTTTARDANTLMAAANDARRLDESTLQRGRAAEERRAVEEDFLFYTPYCPDLVAGKMAEFCIIRILGFTYLSFGFSHISFLRYIASLWK